LLPKLIDEPSGRNNLHACEFTNAGSAGLLCTRPTTRQENTMRAALFAMMAIGAVSALGTTPAAARDYPVCMRTVNDTDDCSFTTYDQCNATASGQAAYCFDSPGFAQNQQLYRSKPAPRRRHRARRAH
jgi:hypothetical protein